MADGILDFEDDAPAGLIVESKPVLFNIVFEDQAGNQGIIVDNTTDSSFMGIDTTKPKLLDVSITSNNPDNTTARKDDQVTLVSRPRNRSRLRPVRYQHHRPGYPVFQSNRYRRQAVGSQWNRIGWPERQCLFQHRGTGPCR